jgi:four helix bundle protein
MRPLLRLVAKATVQRIARDILSLALALAPALALAHSGEMKPQFDHEKLNVYQASLEFMTWATELVSKLDARAAVKDRLDRASTSVPLNIAEGNGKFAIKDRCRFIDFARGSALECAACLDVLVAKRLTDVASIISGKKQLFEIVSMLMGLTNSLTSRIGEKPGTYSCLEEQEQEHE